MINTLRTVVVGLCTMVWHASRILWASFRKSPRFPEIAQEAPRAWSRSILRAARVEVEMVGTEHLASGGPAILVANHESWFDVFVLVAHLPVEYRFVGKVELTRIPLFGPAWLAAGHIAVDRADRKRAIGSLDHAGEVLRRDRAVVVMFPEGTRSPDGDLLPFKKGAFVLAAQTGVPLVPAGIGGSRQVMEKGSFRIRPGRIRVEIGAPIPTDGLGVEARDALLVECRERVERLRRGEGPGPALPAPDNGIESTNRDGLEEDQCRPS